MIYLMVIGWYLSGVFGVVFIGRRIDGKTTRKDLLIALTLGGVYGLLTWIIGIYYMESDWLDKDVF
jgi:hypothetical protein